MNNTVPPPQESGSSPVPAPEKLVLGTRGSDLALAQARMTEAALRGAGYEGEIEIRVVKTIGDKRPDLKLSEFSQGDQPVVDKGIFTRELEDALRRGEIDFAVHSLKDVPTELDAAFAIVATLPRAPVEDVLLTKSPAPDGIASLPLGAHVATSSVRRARQLRWMRPDLDVVDIRGNVPTRLRKLVENDGWDGILLARAGLQRLGYVEAVEGFAGTAFHFDEIEVFAQFLDAREFLPAAGQGAVGIEALVASEAVIAVLRTVDHADTFRRATAERAFLARLQAGCQTPVGAFTWFADDGATLAMRVRVFDESNGDAPPREAEARGPADRPDALADALMDRLSR